MNSEKLRSRVALAPKDSLFPQKQFVRIGNLVNHKRRQVGRIWGELHPEVGRRPDKTCGFVFAVSAKRQMCGFACKFGASHPKTGTI